MDVTVKYTDAMYRCSRGRSLMHEGPLVYLLTRPSTQASGLNFRGTAADPVARQRCKAYAYVRAVVLHPGVAAARAVSPDVVPCPRKHIDDQQGAQRQLGQGYDARGHNAHVLQTLADGREGRQPAGRVEEAGKGTVVFRSRWLKTSSSHPRPFHNASGGHSTRT
jgi:hypothetical protein